MKQAEVAKKLFNDFWKRAKTRTWKYSYEDILQMMFIAASEGRNYYEIHQERIENKTIELLKKEKFIVELYKKNCRIIIPI